MFAILTGYHNPDGLERSRECQRNPASETRTEDSDAVERGRVGDDEWVVEHAP